MIARLFDIKKRRLLAITFGLIPNFLGLYFLDIDFFHFLINRPLVIVNIFLLFLIITALIKEPGRFLTKFVFISSTTMTILLVIKLVTDFFTEQGYNIHYFSLGS